jgi:hypothetical protein
MGLSECVRLLFAATTASILPAAAAATVTVAGTFSGTHADGSLQGQPLNGTMQFDLSAPTFTDVGATTSYSIMGSATVTEAGFTRQFTLFSLSYSIGTVTISGGDNSFPFGYFITGLPSGTDLPFDVSLFSAGSNSVSALVWCCAPTVVGSAPNLTQSFSSTGGSIGEVPPGVPEPATWAMMLVGFAGISFAVRRRSSVMAQRA